MTNSKNSIHKIITVVTKFRIPEERGIAFAVMAMCQAMRENKQEVELLIPKREQTKEYENVDIWSYYQIKRNQFTINALHSFELPKFSAFEFFLKHFRYLFLSWTYSLVLLKFLMRGHREFVYVFHGCLETLLLLRLIKPFYKPFVIYEVHHPPVGWYDRLLTRLALTRTDLLVTCTKSIADYFVTDGFPREKAAGIHDGTRLEDFDYTSSKRTLRKQLSLPTNAIIVGYGGRFVTSGMEKGIPELLKATALLRYKKRKVVVVCVGGPAEYVTKYQNVAKQLNLSLKEAIILDGVPVKTLYKYMRAFDICAMPFPWQEHFAKYMSPLKMFEYMASKNPIIATDLPVVKEVLTNNVNALLVKPDSPNALARGIEKLLRNRRLANKISARAFEDLESKYTWSKRAGKIIALSAKLYSDQSHPR